jgi:multidrug efflux pump subunit AcrA (membrane-fusion protein)
MKSYWKIILAVAIVAPIVFLSLSCTGRAAATATPKPQIATAQIGNISQVVTGTGNLALENKQQLSFGQTGLVSQASNAKISDVLVTEGQVVNQGQVLVKADPKDWQDQVNSDQHALDSTNYSLAQARSNVSDSQAALLKAQNQVNTAQVGVTTAQNNVAKAQNDLATAQYNLAQQTDVKALQDKIDNANIQLQQAQQMLKQANALQDDGNARFWSEQITYFTQDTRRNDNSPNHVPDGGLIGDGVTTTGVYGRQMAQLLADPAHAGVTSSVADINAKVAAVQQAQANLPVVQNSVNDAQNAVVYAQNAVASTQTNLDLAKASVILAQNKVDDAQTALNDDKNSSQQIVAPFKGLITKVNVTTGVIVQRSASLIEIAEPEKFVANILVTERDVMTIKMDGNASVAFDALTAQNFPAKITKIAPLATVSQGVVNYQVTVELTSTTPTFARPAAGAGFTGAGAASGGPPAGGNATGRPQGTGVPSTGAGSGSPSIPAFTLPPANLKDGLSATVTIPIVEKDNVMIVPSRAITRKAGVASVQVVKGTGSETRTVTTGLSDSTNTEITSGLSEGEQILIQVASSSQSGFPRGPFGF